MPFTTTCPLTILRSLPLILGTNYRMSSKFIGFRLLNLHDQKFHSPRGRFCSWWGHRFVYCPPNSERIEIIFSGLISVKWSEQAHPENKDRTSKPNDTKNTNKNPSMKSPIFLISVDPVRAHITPVSECKNWAWVGNPIVCATAKAPAKNVFPKRQWSPLTSEESSSDSLSKGNLFLQSSLSQPAHSDQIEGSLQKVHY